METHAHHLHTTPSHGWKHYFFEFLMLFIAVTLGFFAENSREHFVEHQREKEYGKSLYDDFKTDTATINRTFNEKTWIIEKYDSVLKIISTPGVISNSEIVYYIERYLRINDVFTSQDITYQQLKSSGNFRYLRNLDLYKKIAEYYNLYDRYLQTEPGFGRIQRHDLTELELKSFDIPALTKLDNNNGSNFYDLVNRPDQKLPQIAADDLKILYLKIHEAKLQAQDNKAFLAWLGGMAEDALKELKKEYHLE